MNELTLLRRVAAAARHLEQAEEAFRTRQYQEAVEYHWDQMLAAKQELREALAALDAAEEGDAT